jgi:hypothetical protein
MAKLKGADTSTTRDATLINVLGRSHWGAWHCDSVGGNASWLPQWLPPDGRVPVPLAAEKASRSDMRRNRPHGKGPPWTEA